MHFPAGKDDYFEKKIQLGVEGCPPPPPLNFFVRIFFVGRLPYYSTFFTLSLYNQSDIGFSILATFFRMHLDMNHLDNHHWSIHVTMTNIILLSMLVHLRYAMPNPDHPPPTQGWIFPFPPSAPPQGSLDSHKNCLKIGMIPLFVILKQIFGM